MTGSPPAHNIPVSQHSASPARNACFSQALTPAPLQTAGRREGTLWHIACNPSISASQQGWGCVSPRPPAVAMTGCAVGIQARQTLVARVRRVSQRHGWGGAICQGPQLRAESANSCPSRLLQLIVEAAGGRRAFHAFWRDILPFSSLP